MNTSFYSQIDLELFLSDWEAETIFIYVFNHNINKNIRSNLYQGFHFCGDLPSVDKP